MNKDKRTYRMFIEDILTAFNRIDEYTSNYDFNSFVKDQKTIAPVIRNFEIIGEAVNNLPSDIKNKYPDIPWKEMYLLRNKVSHEYFGVDYEIIWDEIKNYLPQNKLQIETLLKDLSL